LAFMPANVTLKAVAVVGRPVPVALTVSDSEDATGFFFDPALDGDVDALMSYDVACANAADEVVSSAAAVTPRTASLRKGETPPVMVMLADTEHAGRPKRPPHA